LNLRKYSTSASDPQAKLFRSNHGSADAALEGFLLPLEVLDFGEAAALAYGAIRAVIEKAGTPIGSMDTLIVRVAV